MLARSGKLFLAIGLVAAVWLLTTPGRDTQPVWLRPAEGKSGSVRILQFYTSVGSVSPGESAMLCYGVENARTVRISPPMADVFPATKRCLEIVPKHTTHYTILAEGFDGHVAMQSLTLPVEKLIPVKPPRPVNFALVLASAR
jgi:hypothetical protein